MQTLQKICGNYVLCVALLAWVAAQVSKTILNFVATKKFHAERLVGAGGMPSAHSALVCSMSIAVSKLTGVNSPEFAIAFILAAVVMYDAMGVRRAAGEQAKVLNKIVFHWDDIVKKEPDSDAEGADDASEELSKKELKEFLGHTPLEVLGGALLGILIAMLIPKF